MFNGLKRWLRNSSHAHMRQAEVASLSDLVSLLDGFLDNNLRYPLEWDDFISWENRAPAIEEVRKVIEATEPLFFSTDPEKQAEGAAIVLEQRNRAAAFLGRPARTLESL